MAWIKALRLDSVRQAFKTLSAGKAPLLLKHRLPARCDDDAVQPGFELRQFGLVDALEGCGQQRAETAGELALECGSRKFGTAFDQPFLQALLPTLLPTLLKPLLKPLLHGPHVPGDDIA